MQTIYAGVVGLPRPERALDGDGGAVAYFAAGLRQLRERAGSPGYRSLASRANYSPATLAAAASGRRLPTLAVTLAYVAACGGDVVDWEARWRSVAGKGADLHGRSAGSAGGPAPYRGLAAFEAGDADWFFGRETLVREVLERLSGRRFLAVVGASGVGKSSLLRAGLVPAVRDGRLPDGRPSPAVVMTPGSAPMAGLAVRLAALAGVPAGALLADLTADPARAHLAVRQALSGRPASVELLLVVDQFEETFTVCHDARARGAFVTALLAMCQAEESQARVVVAVRADYFARCAEQPPLRAALADAYVPVGAMSGPQVREAVVRPAERAGLMVEGALVSAIVAEVADRPGALPLASQALLEAWRRRRGSTISMAGYEAAGGIDGAVSQTAEAVYRGLDDAERQIARRVLLRSIHIGDDGKVSRRPVNRAEFTDDEPRTSAVLDRLAAARLLSLDRDTVEMTHEALIRAWPRLRAWVEQDRDGLRIHRRISAAAAAWEGLDRDPGALYRGIRLSAAARWVDSGAADLNASERRFLAASLTAQQRELTARRRRVRTVLSAVCAVLVVVACLAGVAWAQGERARAERDLAVSRQIIANARARLTEDPELALLLAERAYRLRANPDSEAILRQAAVESRLTPVPPSEGKAVTGVTFSPDGRRLASVSGQDGIVRVWDETGRGRPVVLDVDRTRIRSVAFSPDGRRLAIAAANSTSGGRTLVFDLAHPRTPMVLLGAAAGEARVAFSPDGRRLASAIVDGPIQIWDTATWRLAAELHGVGSWPAEMVFSSDGLRISTVDSDGTMRIWDAAGRRPPLVRDSRDDRGLAVSPDGRRFATATGSTVRIWDAAQAGAIAELATDEGPPSDVAFSPDGRRVAASSGRTIRIWEVANPVHPLVLRGHRNDVTDVALSPDGRRLASTGDRSVRVWDIAGRADPVVVPGHQSPTPSIPLSAAGPYTVSEALSPDGRYTASAGADGTIRLSRTSGGRRPTLLYGAGNPTHMALGPGGRVLVSRAWEGGLRVWNTAVATHPTVLDCPRGNLPSEVIISPDGVRIAAQCMNQVYVWRTGDWGIEAVVATKKLYAMAFSPDGRHIAGATWPDGTVVILDLATGSIVELHSRDPFLTHLAFSPDGEQLAAASLAGSTRIWRTGGGGPTVLPGPTTTNAFSPDGKRLATVAIDGTVRIWNTDHTAEPVVLPPYGPPPITLAFDADGKHFVSTHTDHSTRTWPCEVCGPLKDLLALAAQRTTRQLTSDERRTYLHG